jgi:hypothetical protein
MAGKFPKVRCRKPRPRRVACLSFSLVSARRSLVRNFEVTGIDILRALDVSHSKFYHDVVYRRSKRYVVGNVDVLIARFHERGWSVRVPRVTGRVTGCLGPDLWVIADTQKLEADLSCRRNTLSPDTESGELHAYCTGTIAAKYTTGRFVAPPARTTQTPRVMMHSRKRTASFLG